MKLNGFMELKQKEICFHKGCPFHYVDLIYKKWLPLKVFKTQQILVKALNLTRGLSNVSVLQFHS